MLRPLDLATGVGPRLFWALLLLGPLWTAISWAMRG
jgi:hypothetical protein